MSANKYQCPACGFQIFNRRVSKCEGCGDVLPKALLFTSEEIAALDAQYERNRKEREEQGRKARSYDLGGSGGGDGFGSFDIDGDGGGCD